MDDNDVPELEDFTDTIQSLKRVEQESNQDIGDITKPKDEFYNPSLEQQTQKQTNQFQGLKKGFLNSSNDKKPNGDQNIITPTNPKKNPLEIDEVQQNMNSKPNNMQQFVLNSKDQWLNEDLLKKISQNPLLQKLFTNPEYLRAIGMMQHNPKQVMAQYSNNPEFMELLQEFMKMMGQHFHTLGETEQKQKATQNQPAPQQKIQEVQKPKENKKMTQEEIIQDAIQNDPQVLQILQNPKVQAFIEYLQKNRRIDYRQIISADPDLGKMLEVLIKKKILNLEGA